MSTQKTSDASIEEMDLTDIFSLFKRGFYGFLALGFKAIDFMLKFWWVLLVLIALGILVGKLLKGEIKYRSTLIVQTNFDSQSYVYNAIKQLDDNLSERDSTFLKKMKFNLKAPEISSIGISPIVDIAKLLKEIKGSDSRNLSTVIKELAVDEGTEIFASDQFYSNYKFHKIELSLRTKESEASVARVLNYINNQPLISKIKDESIENLTARISKNERTIDQIDKLIDSYSTNIKVSNEVAKNLSYFNNQNNLNIDGAIQLKNQLIVDNQILKNMLIISSDTLVVLSDIQIVKDEKLSDKKHLLYPLLLVMLFLVLAGIRYTYKTLRTQLIEENLLD